MTKKLIALALASVVFGCSSSNDDGGDPPAGGADAPTGEGTPTEDGAPAPPAGGGTPTTDSKAGIWTGNWGFGDGVLVVRNDNSIAGLALSPDGSANSIFGSLGEGDTFEGELDNHTHAASNEVAPGVFAQRGAKIDPVSYSLNIVNGQTIESIDDGGVLLTFAAPGEFTPATAESVSGDWQSSHSFCGETDCFNVIMNVSFNGETMTGNTDVVDIATGESTGFSPNIQGTVAPFGDAMNTSFTWNDLTFEGVMYFAEDGRLVFNADDTSGEPDSETLSSILTKQ